MADSANGVSDWDGGEHSSTTVGAGNWEDDDEVKLYASRIPRSLDSAGFTAFLTAALQGYGELVATVNTDKETGESKGFGFVVFANSDDKARAAKKGVIRGLVTGSKQKKEKVAVQLRGVERGREGRGRDKEDQVCYAWTQGTCRYAEGCKFEHTGEGSCVAPEVLALAGADPDSKRSKKKKLCWAYNKGKCKLGDACPRLHEGEVKAAKGPGPCFAFAKGECTRGSKCRFSHGDEDEKPEEAKPEAAGGSKRKAEAEAETPAADAGGEEKKAKKEKKEKKEKKAKKAKKDKA
jgi:hypothetical protein